MTLQIKSDFVSLNDGPGATLKMIFQEKHQHSDMWLDCNFKYFISTWNLTYMFQYANEAN